MRLDYVGRKHLWRRLGWRVGVLPHWWLFGVRWNLASESLDVHLGPLIAKAWWR